MRTNQLDEQQFSKQCLVRSPCCTWLKGYSNEGIRRCEHHIAQLAVLAEVHQRTQNELNIGWCLSE